MSDPFEVSKDSIAWAKNHIAEADREIHAFLDDKAAYAIVTDRDSNADYNLLKLVLRKRMPLSLNGHVSDAANNLRSALDQAVCSVTDLCGLPTHTTYFPIARTETEFENTLNGRCGKLPQEIRNFVRGLKPYKGGNDALWALNKLSGTNKHGILKPIAFGNFGAQISGQHRGMPLQFPYPPRWDSAKQEMILVRDPKTARVPEGEFTVNYEYTFSIAFNEIDLIDGEPIVPVLNHFAGVVESVVMGIEAETVRLGL